MEWESCLWPGYTPEAQIYEMTQHLRLLARISSGSPTYDEVRRGREILERYAPAARDADR